MKRRLYDISLYIFPIILRVVALFHKKARLMIEGRSAWKDQLKNQKITGKRCWFHCASLGEFEQGRPLIEKVKHSYPDYSIIITFFSSSGFEVQKNYELADYVCYLPFDGRRTAKAFVELLKPELVIFIKYEFWYYYLLELKNNQIPTFLVSAIFRPEQQFFKKGDVFFSEMLTAFHHIFVQNSASKELLNKLDLNNVSVSGDTRFDRVVEICSNPKKIELAEIFKGTSRLMVIGSSWPEDIDVLLPIINDPNDNLKIIIAPHEVEKDRIKKLCSRIKCDYQLFSMLDTERIVRSKVLIIDSIGLLSSLYQYGDIAYIGGAFGDGLHNILEAATFGMPIIFGKGKDNKKYQEAMDLLDLGGAFEIKNSIELSRILEELLRDTLKLQSVSAITKNYVVAKAGATKIIMDHLRSYLN